MEVRQFQAGDVVYQEGDDAHEVFLISDGDVEVLRDVEGTPVPLGVLRHGQIFGEVGVIRAMPRSTTTRCLTDTSIYVIRREHFLAAFSGSSLALEVLRTLCERLTTAYDRLFEGSDFGEPASVDAGVILRIMPGSSVVESQIGQDGICIGKLPFRVGRRVMAGEPASETESELALVAKEKHRISPEHFAIESRTGVLVVRDLGTYLGTIVNGRRISNFDESSKAQLRLGRNIVQAGGADSPYTFILLAEIGDEASLPEANLRALIDVPEQETA